jgi:ATP-dependent Lon protease
LDIDHENKKSGQGGKSPDGQDIARSEDLLPAVINILPLSNRPFFPGQAMPLIVDAKAWSRTLKEVTDSQHEVLGLLAIRSRAAESAQVDEFFRMGTACRVHHVHRQEGKLQVMLAGLQRFRIVEWLTREAPFKARVRYYPEQPPKEAAEIKPYAVALINTIKELLPLNPLYGEELKMFLDHFGPDDPSHLADFAASLTTSSKEELQSVLEAIELIPRLEKSLVLLNQELELAKAQAEIRAHVEKEIQARQRDVFLREQLKVIQKELGISKDDRTAEAERFRARLEKLELPPQAENRIEEEFKKFSVLEIGSPEYTVTRNYLDWLTILPWGVHTRDALNLAKAKKILDRDHDGLEDVKERILEFIAVGKMRGEVAGSILLFVGPPGVGKTSLGHSIADALDRRFYRFSLGGMRDEAEIKGHRRTYIGAMPGKFIQAIKEAGSSNPLIMLDEIDKIGASYHGDPGSALLEVLDPQQNAAFLDHYLDVHFSLSKVLFICTANQLDTIPGPLLDRMEIIRLSGYLADEKYQIARNHLLPRLIEEAGLAPRGQLRIEKPALMKIIEQYSREAGVRRLEKCLGRIVRKAVVKLLKRTKPPIVVRSADVNSYLGRPLFTREKPLQGIGVVTGLAWTAMGGATLSVEANHIHDLHRGFKLTGQLGGVMKESAEIAYSYIVANAEQFGIREKFFDKALVHLHVPAGATPKDGPSAGITMGSALLSLGRGRKLLRKLAMTGELTLTGYVLPVGGIREKVIAARRTGYKELVLPEANRGDYEEVPEHIRKDIHVHFLSCFPEIIPLLFERHAPSSI